MEISLLCFSNPTSSSQQAPKNPMVEAFLSQFNQLQERFLGQSLQLWLRGCKFLQKHLNASHHTQPVNIIFIAAHKGSRELLPVGTTLIFYKYCDHESAAFKDVLLTVLLEEETLETHISLQQREESARDFLWAKFIDTRTPSSHDHMDSDKLSGLWGHISHLVLPTYPVQVIEKGGCHVHSKP
ncbi:LOW QUALITY PROTEIN: torsin-1A-interacting protein 2-like [Guaruba guarouba]